MERLNLQLAIDDYHRKTCIRWIPGSGQGAHVHFQNVNEGCAYSDNCYTGRRVTASFGGCKNWDTMVHEMGHALCFGHEQDRADRNNYLDSPRCTGDGIYDHLNFYHLYDYRSVMHYGMDSSCFKFPGVTSAGSSVGLNVLDAEKLNDAYNCQGCLSYRFRFVHQIDSNSNPVAGGSQGSLIMYPCRAYVNGDIVLGKARLSFAPACFIPHNGREVMVDSGFEVLTNPSRANLRWIRSSVVPVNAIAGGRNANDEALYVARCYHTANGDNLVTLGYTKANTPSFAYIAHGGAEMLCSDFEVLVC